MNRRALPPPVAWRGTTALTYVAPTTATQRVIEEVWAQELEVDKVDLHATFFDLGGNSLQFIAMIHPLEKRLNFRINPATSSPVRWPIWPARATRFAGMSPGEPPPNELESFSWGRRRGPYTPTSYGIEWCRSGNSLYVMLWRFTGAVPRAPVAELRVVTRKSQRARKHVDAAAGRR
jgi:acyl carrier protein